MARVFIYLSVANILLLIGAATIGLLKWGPAPDRHIILAVLSLLLSSFMQVLAFTYFNVTGKMLSQAIHLSGAKLDPLYQQKRIKYRYMWQMAMMMGTVLFSIATGATLWRSRDSSHAHLVAALFLIAVHLVVLMKEYSLIVENSTLVLRELKAYEHWKTSQTSKQITDGPASPR